MKNMFKTFEKVTMLYIGIVIAGLMTSCDYGFDLPDAGSVVDTTAPVASFSYAADPTDFTIVNFTDLSSESVTYLWDFDGKGTSTEQDPTFTFTDGEGVYPVTLTSADGLGVSSSVTIDVAVTPAPYQPVILEPGFEDGMLDGATGDGRDSWRNSDLGGVIQITGSPVVSGVQGAKLTGSPNDARIGYQEIIVEAETNYNVNFIYTIKTEPVGYITVDILDVTGGTITSQEDAENAVLGSVTVNNQEDDQVYENGSVSFNSGSSTKIAIYFHNEGSVESRLDDFSIDIAPEGAIPPSPAFTFEQSESNYLEYVFTNTSVDATDYTWDFGDESEASTEESPTHVYDVASVYTIKLIATSSETGLTAEFSTSIDIQAPVTAAFSHEVGDAYNIINFTDESVDAESLLWDFGDGFQFTGMNPSHQYGADGSYTVTLTATSVTGLTSEATAQIAISAGAIIPVITNGNFDDSSSGWKPGDCTGCSTSGFNGSSDGSWYDYAGILGIAKTKGAKYTATTSGGEFASSDTRYGYQAVEVTPNTTYVLEYEYAIKDDTEDGDGVPYVDPSGGRRVVAEILDGYFDDAADAVASTKLVSSSGYIAEGKFSATVGTKVTVEFTSNDSGEIAIFLWAETPVDAWFDNIKVYPKD